MSADDIDDGESRLDYETNPRASIIIYQSNFAESTSPACERNVQIYPVPDPEDNLYYFRTDIQAPPYQVRMQGGDFDIVCMRISTLANDDTIPKLVAKCLCRPCQDDVAWDDPEPTSCENCEETCLTPSCPGYRVCRFHFCSCDTYGRYNLRSGRR
jgi:hypothetical protein